jgi:hypothetical protein
VSEARCILVFETNHFISQTMYQPYQMPEVTPNTYKALRTHNVNYLCLLLEQYTELGTDTHL